MARVRGGNTGYAVSLVIFGFLFVVSALFAIIFYTKIEVKEKEATDAKAEMAKYIKSSETAEASEFGGDGQSPFADILKQRENLLAEKKELLRQISVKQGEFDQLNEENTDNATNLEAVKAKLAAAETAHRAAQQKLQDRVLPVLAQMAKNTEKYATLEAELKNSLKDSGEVADLKIVELNKEIDALKAEQEALKKELSKAKQDSARFLAMLPKLPENNTALVDGRVASVIKGSDDLFISLGRRNGLVMGMTFEVYEPNPILRLTDLGEARGKATIEVYQLKKDTATCRVVRMGEGERIEKGDPIVNLAFDPNMDITIFPYGYFDIEGDRGKSDIGRIRAMITQGGATIPELTKNDDGIPVLTPDMDFIVLGTKPEFPEEPSETLDPAVIRDYQARLAEYKAYFRILDEAKVMRIPVLNQNRFLILMGYYTR